jgi:serine protease AprX
VSREHWIQKLSPAIRNNYIKNSPKGSSRLLLEFNGRKYDYIVDLVKANQGKILHSISLIPLLAVEIPLEALPKVANSLHIGKIWDDSKVSLQDDQILLDETTEESPVKQNSAYRSISQVESQSIQEYDYTGKGIVVAVLDTGVFPHQDLIVPNNRIVGWKDFINHRASPYDDHGHGTEIAGIIAGNGNASDAVTKGMAPEAWLVGVKILDQDGNGRLSHMIAGIEWCVRNLPLFNIRILCLSVPAIYQDRFCADPFARIISMAWRRGITVFTPVETQKHVSFYGLPKPFVSVASLNYQQTLALNEKQLNDSVACSDISKALTAPDLIAEGEKVVSLNMEDGYKTCSGNTIATAMAAGGAAMVLEKWPKLGPARVKYILTKRARDLGLGQNLQGSGLLNLNVLGNSKKRAAFIPSALPLNMNQILPAALKLLTQNAANSGKYPNELFMNLIGSLIRNWTHSSDSIN